MGTEESRINQGDACHPSSGLLVRSDGRNRQSNCANVSPGLRHYAVGLAAAAGLLALYSGVVTIAQGFQHAVQQASSQWYWIVPLTMGFGTQAGLFSYLRHGVRKRSAAARGSVTASGGVSAGSMLACCAHHLSDVLPLIGIAGIAGFLAQYQGVFLLAGVLSNLAGIVVMLEAIQCAGLRVPRALDNVNMRLARKWTVRLGLATFATVTAATLVW